MLYQFRAIKDTKIVIKKIEADNESAVLSYLKSNNYFPIEIKPAQRTTSGLFNLLFGKVSFNDIVDVTRQIAIMLNAGLTIVDALDILKKQITKPRLLKMIDSIDADIKSGSTFSSALKKFPGNFSNLYISLVKSGEASGKLSDILLKLSDNLEKEREFKGKLKGALIYPIVVIAAMLIVIFIMITFVIPRLLDLYKDFNVELPMTTQILMIVSSFCVKFWPLIIGGTVVGIGGLKKYLETRHGKLAFDNLMFKLPVISNVVKVSSLVDATRTLAILTAAGVSILDGLNIVIETTSNIIFQDAFRSVYKKIEKGQSFGVALEQEGIFPPILVQMALVGEQTGHLDDTLLRLSNYFEMESEIAIKAMTTLIEPAILVVLGFGVGFLVISVITPIYNLTGSLK
jgi:type IV pilus assembly protein PilC